MSLYERYYPEQPSGAGGEATFGEIFDAAELAGTTVDNSNAPLKALEEAYDLRIDAIEQATGVRLEHPRARAMRSDPASLFRNPFKRLAEMDAIPEHLASFRDDMEKLAEKYPDAGEAFALDLPFEQQARDIAKQADEDLARLSASRRGGGKYAALLAGGIAAAVQDPVQTPLMVLGGGPGAARTISKRILTVAIKEALISGVSEAGLQPFVQKWREEVGLPSGFGNAAEQVLFATVLGGAIGGAGRSGAEALGALDGFLQGKINPVARAAGGDGEALRATLGPVRDNLPAEARGALDALDADLANARQRLKGIDPQTHDALTARALDDLQADGPSNRLGEGLDAQRRVSTADDADIIGQGPHGPILDRVAYQGRWRDAVARLQDLQDGEIPGALFHPEVGEIDVVWGVPESRRKRGAGLVKILDKHPEVVADLPAIVNQLDVVKRTENRMQLENERYKAAVRLEYDGEQKTWLLTAFEKRQWREGRTESRPAEGASGSAPALTEPDIRSRAANVQQGGTAEPVADARGQYALPLELAELDRMPQLTRQTPADLANTQTELLLQDADLQAEFPLVQMLDDEGRVVAGSATLGEALEDADRGIVLADILDACKVDR